MAKNTIDNKDEFQRKKNVIDSHSEVIATKDTLNDIKKSLAEQNEILKTQLQLKENIAKINDIQRKKEEIETKLADENAKDVEINQKRLNKILEKELDLRYEIDDIKKRTGIKSEDIGAIETEILNTQKKINDKTEEEADTKEYLNYLTGNLLKQEKERLTTIQRTGKVLNDISSGVTKTIGFFSTVKNAGETLIRPWAKVSDASSAFAKNIGLSQKGMKALINDANNLVLDQKIGIRFNVSSDELIKLQQSFSSAVGRNINLSNTQATNVAAMNAVVGETSTIDFLDKYERFGIDANAMGEHVFNLYKESAAQGIAFSKSSKNVLDNFKIAQNYTFKNGVRSFENMAKFSAKMRMDMQSTANFADKVSTIEGAITSGAHLQVLGGNFAKNANPLNMLYESWNDLEALQKRQLNMFKGMGTFNAETGEVKLSGLEQKFIEAGAKAIGSTGAEMKDAVQTQIKRSQIEKSIGGGAFGGDEELKEFFLNTAQYNTKSKSWEVRGADGKGISANNFSKADMQTMISKTKTEAENIQDIAEMLRGFSDTTSGLAKQRDALMTKWFGGVGQTVQDVVAKIGVSNGFLAAIAVATVAMALSPVAGSIGRGLRGIKGKGGGAIGGSPAPATASGAKTLSQQQVLKNLPEGSKVGKNGTYSIKGVKGRVSAAEAQKMAQNNLAQQTSKIGKYTKWGSSAAKIGAGVGTLGLGIAGGVLDSYRENQIAKGKIEGGSSTDKWMGAGAGAMQYGALGAGIGGMIAGPIGMAIGGALGAIGGAVTGYLGARKREKQGIAEKYGIDGSKYKMKELRELELAMTTNKGISNKLSKKMQENGDFSVLQEFSAKQMNSTIGTANLHADNLNWSENGYREQMAGGGILSGPSHGRGGMKVQGSNVSVEGGEFVVNKGATASNLGLLNAINADKTAISSREPLGKMYKVAENRTGASYGNFGPSEINVKPIDIRLSGSIKLETPSGQSISVGKEILDNPVFIQGITNLVSKEMVKNEFGGFRKKEFRQRW